MKKRNQRAHQFILIALLCGSVGFAPAAAWAQSAKEKTDSVVSGKKTPTSPDPAPPKKEEPIPPLSEVDPLPEPALVGPDSEGEALSTETPYLEEREHKNIEEIIVTASKRAENIQNVPISMTALGGQTLRDAGITTFSELQQYVPNLEIIPVTDTRSTSIRIRGIGSVGSNAGIDPSVGVFIDGVYQGRAGMSVGDLLDIERVEVLRGPQGTLYGKNTAAGALNIITRRPTYEKEAFLEGVSGNYRDLQGRAYVNLPLVEDTLAFRVAGYYSSRDGWDINRYNNQDVNNVNKWGLRGKLLWDVTDDLEILLTGDYSREDSRSFVAEIIDYRPWYGEAVTGVSTSVMNLPFNYFAERPGSPQPVLPTADPYDFSVGANVEPKNRVDVGGVSLDALYEWGEYDIRWLNAWRTYFTDSQFDADFSVYDGIKAFQFVNLNQFSSEFTVTSPAIDLPLWEEAFVDYQAGFYFFYMNMDTTDRNGWEDGIVATSAWACDPVNPNRATTCNPFPSPSGFPTAIFPEPTNNINTNTHVTKTFAAYGQSQFHIFDSLQFVAGLRLSWEKKNRDGFTKCIRVGAIPPSCIFDVGLFGPDISRSEYFSTTKLQYRFALQYEPTENTMLYASVANGFKSGGFNQLRQSETDPTQFGDENSLTFELGARTDWLDRQVVFNMTGYFTDYDDFQSQVFDGSSVSVRNAGRLFSYGFESDFIYMPEQIDNLRVGATVSLNIARYKSFDQAASTVTQQVALSEAAGSAFPAALACSLQISCDQDLGGKTLDNAPEWDLSAFAAYERLLPATSVFAFVRSDYAYKSSLFLSQDLDPYLFQPGYHLLNLRFGVRAEDDLWELTFWLTNVTNSEYMIIGFDVPLLSGFAGVRGPPRQFGATVRLLF